jgi:hypothetical protein
MRETARWTRAAATFGRTNMKKVLGAVLASCVGACVAHARHAILWLTSVSRQLGGRCLGRRDFLGLYLYPLREDSPK